MKALAVLIVTLILCAMPSPGFADSTNDDYIRVEIQGTLTTGVMAIGAETTGSMIRSNEVSWELDFGDRKDLRELASKLDKQKVIVTGTYRKVRGVEIRERHIVKISTLKAAEGR